MDNVLRYFKNAAGKIGTVLDKTSSIFDNKDPLIILPYRGFANEKHLYLKGRVLENENIFQGKSNSEIRNLIDSFKRFETDEVGGAKVRIVIADQSWEVKTDHEGYFTLETDWTPTTTPVKKNIWIHAHLNLVTPRKEDGDAVNAIGEILLLASNADYGVITDVDDTVLQTHVTSLFKLKMLYATFIKDAHQRLPMEGILEIFKKFEKGGDQKKMNPVFYVSNSPWNLYDLLEEFFKGQNFPKGPILLRDYGVNNSGPFSSHKMKIIAKILETYTELPFIFLGDTASKDADFYIELAKQYPNRIKVIYIRKTKDNKNARRVAKLIENTTVVPVALIEDSSEIETDALKRGLF